MGLYKVATMFANGVSVEANNLFFREITHKDALG